MYNIDSYNKVLKSLIDGNMILCGGNGGSFSDSLHFCGELIGRYNGEEKTYPGMVMAANQSELTAIANDYGYDNLYIPYIKAFKKFNPSYLFISTSGTSKNVITGIKYIKETYKNYNISLLTGSINNNIDYLDVYKNINVLSVHSKNTQLIQEWHIKILYLLATDIKNGIW